MRTGTLRSLAILFAFGTALEASAITHPFEVSRLTSDSTLRRGATDTGFAFNLSCPEGRVLTGINFRAGGLVDALAGRCTAITAAGAWTGATTSTPFAGGPTGTAGQRSCPTNMAVSGFRGRSGGFLDQLVLECTQLATGGTFNTANRTTLTAVGGTGGTAFSLTRCATPARAIEGTASAFMHSFELACEDNTPLITGATIGSNIGGATNLLRTDSGTSDVACDVTMQGSGPLRIVPSNGLFQISSGDELDRACGLEGFAVVTQQINFCSGIGSSIIGCARPGCMVVVPFGTGAGASQLWAHEFGHTRALPHRNGTGNVMNDTINNGDRINSTECGFYTNPVTAFFFDFLPEQEAQADLPLDAFVAQTFVHGVPYEQVLKYGPAAVPTLVAILRDARQEALWSNAATMLAMLGEPAGVDAVIEFIDKVNPADPRGARAWARNNAVVALGYAAARGASPRALAYLNDSLEGDAWQKRGIAGARGALRAVATDAEVEPNEAFVDEQLTESAIVGLALSGRPEARQRLEAFAGAAGRSERERTLVANVLPEHARVATRGIQGYDMDRRARALDRANAEARARSAPPQGGPPVALPPGAPVRPPPPR